MTKIKKKKRIPKLRFPEFDGEWDMVKLGDFLIPTLRQVPKPLSQYMAIGIRSHFKGTFQKPNSDPAKIAMNELYLVKEGDLIVNITFAWEGAVAIVKKEDEGGLVSHRFPTYVFDKKIVIGDYFRYIYPNDYFKYILTNMSPGGAGRNRVLNKRDFLKIKISIPNIKEQQKIASFLMVVDEKIGGLKKKKEKMEQYKKGVMQKIFSSCHSGLDPESSDCIRLKDENGKDYPAWEEKRLGEIGEIIGGGTPDTTKFEYWNGKINWFTPTEIKQKYVKDSLRKISSIGLQKSSARLLPKNSLLITTRATIGDISIATETCTTNQGFQSLFVNDKNDNQFIYYWISNNKKELLRKANGSTFPEISSKEVKKLKIYVPQKEEQQKIASFLSSLDEKIENINQELTQTQKFKKGLLQVLFV